MSSVAGMELRELPEASSFNLNKVLSCLHGPFKVYTQRNKRKNAYSGTIIIQLSNNRAKSSYDQSVQQTALAHSLARHVF